LIRLDRHYLTAKPIGSVSDHQVQSHIP